MTVTVLFNIEMVNMEAVRADGGKEISGSVSVL
jgi:hypothetical protein